MAAVFDCETALDSLLVATLHSHVGADGDASERGVILRALARFARPRGVSVWRSAASYAQALLGKSDRHPADFSDLVAAALRAKMVDPRVLLHRYSERTYGHPHSSLDLNASREATVMRNITIALHEVGFTPLVDELPTLLTHDYGRAFFKALSNPTYGALDLLDRDGHDYVVRLGPLIAQRLAIKRPPDVPIPIDSQSAEGEVLYRLMEERSVAYRSAQDETLAATLWSTRTQELNDSALVEEGGVLAEEDAAADPVEPYGRITQRLAGSHAHKHYGALAH
jgi:hypothetical protein